MLFYEISMKQDKKGFTLLELLVVVLIIGILAAIALPQYRFAVTKSRYSAVKNSAKALYEAEQRYFLIHDQYTTNQENLDIEVFNCFVENDYDISCSTEGTKVKLEYKIETDTGRKRCCVNSLDETDIYNKVCQKETNKIEKDKVVQNHNCYYYN